MKKIKRGCWRWECAYDQFGNSVQICAAEDLGLMKDLECKTFARWTSRIRQVKSQIEGVVTASNKELAGGSLCDQVSPVSFVAGTVSSAIYGKRRARIYE